MISHEVAALGAGLRRIRDSGCTLRGALATLVRTQGPVFRRAGARMLVLSDGTILRGLSAGCPEADIAERAREVMHGDHARLLRYDREHGFDALLELGCGGEMEVLLEPLSAAKDLQHLELLTQCLEARRDALLMTVFSQNGQCLQKPVRLLWSDGWRAQDIDPELAERLLAQATRASLGAVAQVTTIDAPEGELQVLLERLQPALRLVLLGVNTTALALAGIAVGLGWQVELVDHREDTPAPALPAGAKLVRALPQHLRDRVGLDPRTAVVSMTHNLERDIEYLAQIAQRPIAYLGAIGSRTRAARMRQALGQTARPLYSPAGLDIGAETPEEIALAIASEIQAVVNHHPGGCLRISKGPIH